MQWHYGLLEIKQGKYTEYEVIEIHYDDDGSPMMWFLVRLMDEDPRMIPKILERITKDLKKKSHKPQVRLQYDAKKDMRLDAFCRYQKMPWRWLIRNKKGD